MPLPPVYYSRQGHPVEVGDGYPDGGALHPDGGEGVGEIFHRHPQFACLREAPQLLERNLLAVMAGYHPDAGQPAVGMFKLPICPEPPHLENAYLPEPSTEVLLVSEVLISIPGLTFLP